MIGTRSRSLAVVSALQEWDNRRCSGSKTGSEPFNVRTISMRRNQVASIAAKMSTKLLPDCHH